MIIQLQNDIRERSIQDIENKLASMQIPFFPVRTQKGDYLICTPRIEFDIRKVGSFKGIKDVHRVTGQHKLVSREWKVGRVSVDIDDQLKIGDGGLAIMAGPCSIENEKQVESIVDELVAQGVQYMRGGVYKPRTSPYSFRGLGMDGLRMFSSRCREKGIRIITEVMETAQIEDMFDYVDIYQVGARNTQNFNLLEALGKVDKPVLIKRGISGTIDELLYSAEYVFKNGNERILLCERGIRTFEHAYRNTLDLNAVPILKAKSHLPVIVDPSHGIGIRSHVLRMSLAAVASGADGLLIEIHPDPDNAATDGQQTIDFSTFEELVDKVRAIHGLLQ